MQLLLLYLAFVSLGLPDAVLGVAWPKFRDSLGLPQEGIGLIAAAGGMGYFLSSLLAGSALNRITLGSLLSVSTALVVTGLLGYSTISYFPGILIGSFVIGLGSGAIDSALNTFASVNLNARQMNWLHAFWAVGATIGPIIMTTAIVTFQSWRLGYGAISLLLSVLCITFLVTRTSWQLPSASLTSSNDSASVSMFEALHHPLILLQISFYFVYAGVEGVVGLWNFTLNTEARSIGVKDAGLSNSLYWGGLMFGRFFLGAVAGIVSSRLLIIMSLTLLLVAQILFNSASQGTALFGLVLTGLSLSPLYPTLMSQTPKRIGNNYAAHAVGFQVSACTIGMIVLPGITAMLVGSYGLEAVPIITLICSVALCGIFIAINRLRPVVN